MFRAVPTQRRRTGFLQRLGQERPEWNCGNPMLNLGPLNVAAGKPNKRKSMNYDYVRAEALNHESQVKP
jgi:hypothetical protein